MYLKATFLMTCFLDVQYHYHKVSTCTYVLKYLYLCTLVHILKINISYDCCVLDVQYHYHKISTCTSLLIIFLIY